MKEFIDAISQVGFPIVISLLLLVRIEGNQQKQSEKFTEKIDIMGDKLDKNTEAINYLSTIIKERMPKHR